MAAQRECAQHPGRPLMLFCGKCIHSFCLSCIIQQPLCHIATSQAHELMEVENMPAFLRNQLDSIQAQLRCEQSALLERANSVAGEAESREKELNMQVERVLQCRDEALQVIQQLQTAILAAATSAIASVLRAGIESDSGKQNVEDVHARALACRQQSRAIARLHNMNDSALLNEMAFVRNLIRCAAPDEASTTAPVPSSAEPSSGPQLYPSSSFLSNAKASAIESKMQNIVKQGTKLSQSLGNSFDVC